MNKQDSSPKMKLEWGKLWIPAIVGLVGVLATAICGCISTIVVAWIGSSSSSSSQQASPAAQSISTPELPVITYETLHFSTVSSSDMSIFGKGQGDEYFGISPTTCWNMYFGKSAVVGSVAVPQSEVHVPYNFAVLSSKPVIISDISLYLDQYTPPLRELSLTEGIFVSGRGGGEVVKFDLKNATIGKNFDHISLGDGKAYQLEENDTVSFSTGLYFVEPGEYQLHIELKVDTYAGESYGYTSDPIRFSWFYVDDLNQIILTDVISGETITSIQTPCK